MSRADAIVDRGAQRLQELAARAASAGGAVSRLAEPLADDAAFVRRLKPSLIAARARGEAPTDLEPGADVTAPAGRQLGRRRRAGGGPSPLLVVVGALALGIALAKVIDWRSHAHPRD